VTCTRWPAPMRKPAGHHHRPRRGRPCGLLRAVPCPGHGPDPVRGSGVTVRVTTPMHAAAPGTPMQGTRVHASARSAGGHVGNHAGRQRGQLDGHRVAQGPRLGRVGDAGRRPAPAQDQPQLDRDHHVGVHQGQASRAPERTGA
jgi:hypothetical protein